MSNTLDQTEGTPAGSGTGPAAVIARYRQACQYANALNRLGEFVKIGGPVVGGLVMAVGFISCASSANSNSFGPPPGVLFGGLAFIAGIVIGACGFLFGFLVQSQGQQLLANLDCAVHGSPFLSDQQKAAALGL